MPGRGSSTSRAGFVAMTELQRIDWDGPDPDPGQAAVSVDPVAFAARARPARALRRAHPLPAAAGDGQGARAVRHRRPADRAAVAAGLPRRRRRAGRDAARLRRTPLLGAAPTRTGRTWRSSSTTGRPASPPACPTACTARPSTRSPVRRRTSRARLAEGAEIFKVHVQVGAFDVRDPLLADVWGVLEDAGTPVVIHAGSGPVGTPYTGPGPVADLLRSYPRLALVIAHLGAPEYAEFVGLAETYERVCVDTTMVFTDFFDDLGAAFPADARAAAARPPAEGAARLRLPEHPLPLRHPAGGPGPPRPRRRLAPGGLLGERRRTLRGIGVVPQRVRARRLETQLKRG